MPSYKASQEKGLVPTVTPQYLETARTPGPDGNQKISDALIAEEVAKKDKDFATMWASRRSGGDDSARRLLNYYTYGDENHGEQPAADYQFSQGDAMQYFDNPEDVFSQLNMQGSQGTDTRVPGAFNYEEQQQISDEHPFGMALQPLKQLANVVPSGINLAKNLGTAVLNPIDTVKNLGKTAAGAVSNLSESVTGETQGPAWLEEGEQFSTAFRESMQERFGLQSGDGKVVDFQALGKTMFEDPLGFITDIAVVGQGAKALGNAGKLGKASKMASKSPGFAEAGAMVKAPAKALPAVGKGIEEVYGVTTGKGNALTEFRQGVRGIGGKQDPKVAAEMSKGLKTGAPAMRGYADNLQDALQRVVMKRGDEYRPKLEAISKETGLLDSTDVTKAMQNQMKQFNLRDTDSGLDFSMTGFRTSKVATEEITKFVDEIRTNAMFDAQGWDILKKNLNHIELTTPEARAFATPIFKAIDNMLDTQVKGYADMTKRYREVSNLLREARAELSIGKNPGAVVRKLNQVFRSGFENRKELLRELLEEAGDTTTLPGIAAANLHDLMPAGLMKIMTAGGILTMATVPAFTKFFAAAVLVSPRIVAEFMRTAGFTQRQVDKFIEFSRKIGANKLLKDEAVGGAAAITNMQKRAEEQAEIDRLFPDE